MKLALDEAKQPEIWGWESISPRLGKPNQHDELIATAAQQRRIDA